jgi:hypothetical protein
MEATWSESRGQPASVVVEDGTAIDTARPGGVPPQDGEPTADDQPNGTIDARDETSHAAQHRARAASPLTLRRALLRIGLVAVIVFGVLALGAANDVGPLARVTPPSEVTDPREMVARSLQALIDASSVHVSGAVSGTVPGSLVQRTDERVRLDGTTAVLDVRPQDARSHLTFSSPPLGIDVESLTLWDDLSYRHAGGNWTAISLGSVTGRSGLDMNPLTLVDRLRAWLATPGAPVPTSTDVACDAPSGRCREVHLALGRQVGDVLLRLFPEGSTTRVGPTTTDLVLQTDATTLRPAHLTLAVRDDAGSVDLTATFDFSQWNEPSVIPEPPRG